MSELNNLGRIIDDLLALVATGGRTDKTLVFLVGNGIDPVNNILNDNQLKARAGGRYSSKKAFDAYRWRHFEYARYYSSTSLPTFTHCCIHKLVEKGVCRDVITTNYDMFFDSIWQRSPHLRVCQNPVLTNGEYEWEGFFTPKARAAKRPRYWKVHGSLSHVRFCSSNVACEDHLYRLPRFAISVNDDRLAQKFRIPTQAPYMGFERTLFPRTKFAQPTELQGGFSPYIDWTYNNVRTIFSREIEGAKQVIRNSSKIAALVLIGFSGYFNDADPLDPYNEELIPEIRAIRAAGFDSVFMIVHEKQAARMTHPCYGLMRELAAEARCWPFVVSGDFMSDLLTNYSRKFPIHMTEREYRKWSDWYMSRGEAAHV